MQMQKAIIATAIVAVSYALPGAKRDTTSSQLATFDDIANPTTSVPVPYKGLNYGSANLQSDANPYGHKIIVAQSEPYYIEAAATGSLGGSIDGTETTSFDLDSFYFGCFDARGQEANACNFTVAGLEAFSDRHQGPLPMTYAPDFNSDLSAPMQEVQLGWTGLSSFYVEVVADPATTERLYMTVDNVQYTKHQ